MEFDLSRVPEYFPFEEFREGQRECIEFILKAFESGKKYVVFEGPVGSGKSAVGVTVAKFFENSYYLTVQKILQTQLMNDFGGGEVVDLKGRSAYYCDFYKNFGAGAVQRKGISQKELDKFIENPPTCDNGYCRRKDKARRCALCFPNVEGNFIEKCAASLCPYYKQMARTVMARMAVMNYSSFLYQMAIPNRFMPRELLIIDECLHPHTYIETDIGRVPIGKLVNQKIACRVLSFNQKTRQLEYKNIVRYLKRNKKQTYRVLAGNRVLYPTADHKLYTPNGKKRLSELKIGDLVLVRKPEITPNQQQLVLGSLLGDASLQLVESKRKSQQVNKGVRARIRFIHGPKQYGYICWKYQLMQPHAKTQPQLKPAAGFTKTAAKFSTSCDFYDVVSSVVVGNQKAPNKDWLDKINNFGLAVWFMDDGSTSNGMARFNSQGFDKEQNQLLADWLLYKWGLKCRVVPTSKRGKKLYFLQLGRASTKILAGLIAKYIPPSMRYKLPRWAPHDLATGETLRSPTNRSKIKSFKLADGDDGWKPYDRAIENQICCNVSTDRIRLIEPYKKTFNYDLEVADNHNYFAGNTLVSNCHNSEPQLLDYISVSLNDKRLCKRGFILEEYELPEEYCTAFIQNDVVTKIRAIADEAEEAGEPEDLKVADEYHRLALRLESFYESMQVGEDWVAEFRTAEGSRTVTLKPIFVHSKSHKLLFDYGQKVLLMSATILEVDIFCSSLGIPRQQVAAYRMKNRFPVQNRPIYMHSAGRITGGPNKMHEWSAKLVAKADEVLDKYEHDRGIIHTHNFAIANLLMEKSRHRARFLYQRKFPTKEEMLKRHADSDNTVIVAPAMHEGLDLYGDLSRIQIICKVPWPNFMDNKQLARRLELDRRYYLWLTALKLIQSSGRSIRSEDDWAHTYILDEVFNSFMREAESMIPTWFKDAVEYGEANESTYTSVVRPRHPKVVLAPIDRIIDME